MSKGYNPGQARDENGKWVSSGGVAKRTKSSLNGKDSRKMSGHEKVLAAEIMFGSGSKQHQTAKAAWQKGRRERASARAAQAQREAPKTISLGKVTRTGTSGKGLPGTRSITLGKTTRVSK